MREFVLNLRVLAGCVRSWLNNNELSCLPEGIFDKLYPSLRNMQALPLLWAYE